jgi:hypothetical protein
VRFARIFWRLGPVHEGHGTRQLIIDGVSTNRLHGFGRFIVQNDQMD